MKKDSHNFIYKITEKVIQEWDPLFFFRDSAKISDYSKVVERISPLIKKRVFVCDFAVMVRDIFIEEFGKDKFLFKSNECQHLVYDVYCAISNYEYSDKKINIIQNGIIKTVTLKKHVDNFLYFFEIMLENKKYYSEKVSVIHNEDEYLLFSLNKALPENTKIVCCNTCRFGNFSPYGGSDIFCFKTINVDGFRDKLDVLDNFTDEVLDSRHTFNYYCDHFEPQNESYVYNVYHYYLINPEEKPYHLNEHGKNTFYDERRNEFIGFFASLKNKYIKNDMVNVPEFEEYLKLNFAGADIAAKEKMKILSDALAKNSQSEKLKFVKSVCMTCDEYNLYEIWPSVFSIPLCDFIFNVLKPYIDLKNADFLVLKWVALYTQIYNSDKKLKLAYLEKALIACDYKDEALLKDKSYYK